MTITADLPPTSPHLPPGEVPNRVGTTSPRPVPPVGDGGRSPASGGARNRDLEATSPGGRS